jgi:flagellar basal body-associated protein FliL
VLVLVLLLVLVLVLLLVLVLVLLLVQKTVPDQAGQPAQQEHVRELQQVQVQA